ncbi:MAG: DUF4886 domain-containing protein [Clostridia bacterium]|nr:DUF4886 domain-containing protein [Clostridia bacterium]
MKRFLSIILTVSMLLSMMSVPMMAGAKAYSAIDLSSGFVADTSLSIANAKETAVYGIAGKGASDESVMITENANNWTSWYTYDHGEEIYFENGEPMTGYLVAELNFMAPDAAYLKEFIFGLSTNQARLTNDSTKSINIGEWNHIRMVYWADDTNCDFVDFDDNIPDATTYKLGAADVYVNGVKIGDTKQLTSVINTGGTAYTAPIDTILLEVYSGDKTAQHSTYYDDIKLYKTDTYPAAPAAAALAGTEEFSVSGNTITLADGASVTAADIKAANADCEITAFASNAYSVQLSDDTELAMLNAVVVKSADNVYTYYDVAAAGVTVIANMSEGIIDSKWANKFNQETVTGVAGKASDDKSVLVTSTTPETEANANSFIQTTVSNIAEQGRYFVVSANMMNVDSKTVMLRTSGHDGVSNEIALDTTFTANEWNKVFIYSDFTDRKTHMYVNGTLIGTKDLNTSFESTGIVRFCINGAVDSQYYIDDFMVYGTNTAPDGAAESARPSIALASGMSFADDTLKVLPETTVAAIKAANTNAVRVYTDSTLAAEAEDTAMLNTGMVIAVENNYKSVELANISVYYGENELYFADGTEASPFPAVNNGTGAAAEGFAGKDASDSILAMTTVSDTYFAAPNWGKATKKTDTADATWDKASYNGYLVFEASVFNIDNTVLALVTAQTKAVSGNIAAYVPTNQWSRLKFVYNHKLDDTNFGKTMTYVDGVAKTGWVNSELGKVTAYNNTEYCTALRFSAKGSTSGDVATYVDDIRVYEISQVRPEETTGFKAVENTIPGSTELGIVEGCTVTAEEIKAANADISVKIFNNTTDYTELDDSAALAEGNVVVVMAQSTSAADSNLAINDIIQVMEVTIVASTKDVISSTPTASVRGTITAAEGMVFGNDSSTIKKIVNNAAESNWYFSHDYKGVSTGMNYLVLETDFAPAEDTKDFYVGANQHSPMSATVAVDEQLRANRWHRIVMVYDIAADTSDLYVNGELVSEGYKGCYQTKYAANNNTIQLRIIVDTNGKVEGVSYFDNYKIYEAINYPSIGAPAKLPDGYNEVVSGFADNNAAALKVKSGTAADITVDGADVNIVNSNGEAVDSADTLAAEDLVVIKKNGNFASYDVAILADNDIVVLGSTYDDNTGVMTPGSLSIYGIPADDAVVVAAQYDENGDIIKIETNDSADSSGIIPVEFDVDDIDDSKVKVFMVDSMNNIKPLCANKEINHTRSYNLLMLGNSFSMDVTCYMEEIAAAMGKKLNIGVLNKGGSAIAYHYTNREMSLASSDIMFWLNDKTQGYSNLKTVLESYDWDYVVFQNWGSSKAFYTYSDSNYASNWSKMVDLAKYVHELEPNAKQMIHETWSFEAGYNDFKDVATRDAIGADIRALYTRCAEECAAAIGQSEPLEKISSLDAFEAARLYTDENGVQKFETTYYKDGHLFSGYENRATVPVGDGSVLLNEEDAAAGKISLHRDGFHASQVGRYLIALNAVRYLTGKSVTGNTFRPGEIALDSSAYYGGNEVTDLDNASSGVIYQKYDPVADDVAEILQSIVDGM